MSTNQLLKPVTLKRDKKLFIGGCDMVGLAEKYGTPLYVLDEQTIRNICQDYKSAFSKYKNVKMMYASKALCTSALTKILDSEGFGFDVVSGGEIYTVYQSGIDMSKVLFNGNNKTPEEIELAIKYGVGRFSIDNFHEVELISEISKKYNKTVDALLRITPGIDCHTHKYIQTGQLDCKFGFDLSQIDSIIEHIINVDKTINIRGLHAHIGSQIFEPQCYYDEVEVLVREIARIQDKFNIKMDEMNIGGGLGVKYVETDTPPSTEVVAGMIIDSLNKNLEKYNMEPPTLYLEPGRSIISTAGVTLYTVGSSKQVPNATKYVAVDGGMADNPRPSMYEAQYFAELANDLTGREQEKVTIAGKFCESGDLLIQNIELPKLKAGDILCFYNTGAYNYSMASNYNRAMKPTMVLVNNSQSDIIVYRETLEDLVSHDVIPDRLV
ncbi:MAG: diaminopimelate decarboxylase [Candidatus Gastranaerophilaceae bacterium]